MTLASDRPVPPPARTLSYGGSPDQLVELRPAGGDEVAVSTGVAVVIHGGFWRPEFDRSHAEQQAQAYAEAGLDVAVIEYRRAPGEWEAMASDLRAALGVIRDQLPGPVVLVGHSAGAHLATWLSHQPEANGIRGVVALGGCVDLALVDALDLDNGAARDLMGTEREDDEQRWAAADPAQLGWAPCPVTLLHGTEDPEVPDLVSQSYADRCGGSLQLLPGVGHYEFLDPTSDPWRRSLAAIERFLAAH